MQRAPRGGTNVYRQLDPAISKTAGTPSTLLVTAVVPNAGDNTRADVYFNQPVAAVEGLGLPDWDIGGNAVTLWISFSADRRSMTVQCAGEVEVLADWTFTAKTPTQEGLQSLTGGDMPTQSGVVEATPDEDFFDLISAAMVSTTSVDVSFNSPVAAVCKAGNFGDFTGWTCSAAPVSEINQIISPTVVRLNLDAPTTSGTTLSWPQNKNAFVSLTGATIRLGSVVTT